MNIKIRKQFSKAYQVFEIELDNVPSDKVESANAWLDEVGVKEVNKMADLIGATTTTTTTPKATSGYTKKNYTISNGGGSGKAATPKQIEWLEKYNVDFDPATITTSEASALLDKVFKNDKKDNATKGAKTVASSDPFEEMGKQVAADNPDGLPF